MGVDGSPTPCHRPRILVVVGPTAVGKSAAAVELAERIGGEIVCADSRTVYCGMDIGTAKPTPQMRERVTHHLLDVADPRELFTVRDFQRMARAAIDAIRARGRTPVLVGGTGLYVRAVVDGLDIPEVPPDWALRRRWEAEERVNPGVLYRRLQVLDPVAASRIPPSNVRRVIRALEVCHHTGRPASHQWGRAPDPEAVQVGLTMDRATLYRRIDGRVDEQIRAGLVDEVRALLGAGVDPALPAMQGLGYKEIVAHLRGEVGLDDAIRALRRNTRRYAKRQLTWFRADPRIRWIAVDGLDASEVAERVMRAVC
ncbi:MAG: tRNA (adenosine(37)-N6)-dimethylallyltransferase MiaA [Armatimonadota bacterium]|nr:tRNA (adenosine(37)-N6)-dimethylallyltransferase MiaA [Armatimonadota bacterium]